MLRMALGAAAAQPVRSAVLACGFGLGIAAMAGLLGVGQVILEQSHAPALRGGGDLAVYGPTGRVENARFLMAHVLDAPPLSGRVAVAAPTSAATLYLLRDDGKPTPIRARGGIPSLERALGDPETSGIEAWRDTPQDAAWAAPSDEDLLRAMDRFHPIPHSPRFADSWVEWLYFNGRGEDARFYLSFSVGRRAEGGKREALVHLRLEHEGQTRTFVDRAAVDEKEVLAAAPDLTIGRSRVELRGLEYHVELALHDAAKRSRDGEPDLTGTIVLRAVPGRAMPPIEIGGAKGWVSGYVVPVLSGEMRGTVQVEGRAIALDGEGYHDHNWGFWEGVTWRWGQVAHDDLSLVYGRVRPPAEAADPDRIPGLLVALGPEGPLGYSTEVSIEETDGPGGRVERIAVEAASPSMDLRLDFTVESTVSTRQDRGDPGAQDGARQFFQMRGEYRVHGTVGDRTVDFVRPGSAETFRLEDDAAETAESGAR
jgi:hypothetical protein